MTFRPQRLTHNLTTGAVGAQTTETTITKGLLFQSARSDKKPQNDKPIVLLLPWMNSKSQHTHKYGHIYIEKGFDVLYVSLNAMNMLLPQRTRTLVQHVYAFLNEPQHVSRPLFVQGLCVGCYTYSELLCLIAKQGEEGQHFGARSAGQVFDSLNADPTTINKALAPNNIVLRKALQASWWLYLRTFGKKLPSYYHDRAQQVRLNALKVPSMMLYSTVDRISDYATVEEVMEGWRKGGVDVSGKCWPDSEHVSHLRMYPAEYRNQIDMFLTSVGLIPLKETAHSRL